MQRFMYYGDSGRYEVTTDDAGNVYAAPALPGNGIFADVREPVRIGRVYIEPSALSSIIAPAFPVPYEYDDEWQDDRMAVAVLVEMYDDAMTSDD
jgi:hypothetical protein